VIICQYGTIVAYNACGCCHLAGGSECGAKAVPAGSRVGGARDAAAWCEMSVFMCCRRCCRILQHHQILQYKTGWRQVVWDWPGRLIYENVEDITCSCNMFRTDYMQFRAAGGAGEYPRLLHAQQASGVPVGPPLNIRVLKYAALELSV